VTARKGKTISAQKNKMLQYDQYTRLIMINQRWKIQCIELIALQPKS